jgi:hypothetical protein
MRAIAGRTARIGKGWWSETTDIIAGGAGIGLFLLYANRELKEPAFRELAIQDGHRLIELGIPEANGTKWRMSPGFARHMPNFSHGTAGIAYFLATLYQETGRQEFLSAALAGATYLPAVAKTDNDACLIFHNRRRAGTCSISDGVTGGWNSAAVYRHQVTGDRVWMEWVRNPRGIMQAASRKRQRLVSGTTSASAAQPVSPSSFEPAHGITKDPLYLEFAKRVTAQLLTRATRDRDGTRWIQAEHRVKPELVVAQTGYMQGAAGIGMLLLHLDGFHRGKKASIIFPDSPF